MHIKFWYILTILVLVADQVSKFYLDGVSADFIPGVVGIESVYNYGASWSIMSGAGWLFIILGVLCSVGMILFDIFYKKDFAPNAWYKIGFSLLLGGILGNLIDRIAFGYVRDFLNLEFMNFPVFNIADMALTVGCICIIIYILFFGIRDKKENTNEKKINK